jgi:hypothetical protein
MAACIRRIGTHRATLLGAAVVGLLMAAPGQADDARASDAADSEDPQPGSRQPFIAKSPAGKPLDLLLTQAELRSIVRGYEIRTGENLTAPIDDEEVIVKAPGVLAPMRDVTQEPWGGLAAPFWAIMHPTQAWRIFLPIPPKGPPKDERPAPDPR